MSDPDNQPPAPCNRITGHLYDLNFKRVYRCYRIAGVSPATVSFAYDANGARTNKTVRTAGVPPASSTTNVTAYTHDEDNRLVDVSIGPVTS